MADQPQTSMDHQQQGGLVDEQHIAQEEPMEQQHQHQQLPNNQASDQAAQPVEQTEPMATICFGVKDTNVSQVLQFPFTMTIAELKDALVPQFNIQTGLCSIRGPNDYQFEDHQMLSSYQFLADEQTAFVTITEEISQPEYSMPDRIDVIVKSDNPEMPPKIVPVRIIKCQARKIYQGGYRNKYNGKVYHHAGNQTVVKQPKKWEGQPEKFHRETQTAEYKSRSMQVGRESGTQMARPDLYLDSSRDRVISPKRYVTSVEVAKMKVARTIQLQCAWRSYIARVRTAAIRQLLQDREDRLAAEEKEKQLAAIKQHQREVERRKHPRTQQDFEILYNELEEWRYKEVERIKEETAAGTPERKAAMQQLLAEETKLIQTIDRLKIQANEENRKAAVQRKMLNMSQPKQWQRRNEDVVNVQTPFTTRASELRDLYNAVIDNSLNTEDRLDVLLNVKWTVKEFDCQLTRELAGLIDREADMLNRGRTKKSLEGLRRRISNQFLQFIESPQFNPEAARFQKIDVGDQVGPEVAPKTAKHL